MTHRPCFGGGACANAESPLVEHSKGHYLTCAIHRRGAYIWPSEMVALGDGDTPATLELIKTDSRAIVTIVAFVRNRRNCRNCVRALCGSGCLKCPATSSSHHLHQGKFAKLTTHRTGPVMTGDTPCRPAIPSHVRAGLMHDIYHQVLLALSGGRAQEPGGSHAGALLKTLGGGG